MEPLDVNGKLVTLEMDKEMRGSTGRDEEPDEEDEAMDFLVAEIR